MIWLAGNRHRHRRRRRTIIHQSRPRRRDSPVNVPKLTVSACKVPTRDRILYNIHHWIQSWSQSHSSNGRNPNSLSQFGRFYKRIRVCGSCWVTGGTGGPHTGLFRPENAKLFRLRNRKCFEKERKAGGYPAATTTDDRRPALPAGVKRKPDDEDNLSRRNW